MQAGWKSSSPRFGQAEPEFQAAALYDPILKLFQRLDYKYERTGIGLAIVTKVSERMGGAVGVESAPGKGSAFSWICAGQSGRAQTPGADMLLVQPGGCILAQLHRRPFCSFVGNL
jgi:hypothetical protein